MKILAVPATARIVGLLAKLETARAGFCRKARSTCAYKFGSVLTAVRNSARRGSHKTKQNASMLKGKVVDADHFD
jgi:hypothetical protein